MRSAIATGIGIALLLARGGSAQTFAIQRVAADFSLPVFATAPPGDGTRLFVVEQHTGRIEILRLSDLTVLPVPFLTVPGVAQDVEQGLLGLAFHPDYASNGYFYVSFTDPDHKVVRYQVSADPNVADAGSATPVLGHVAQGVDHNGGWIAFGPDDLLYVATGDGGGGDDPENDAQDLTGNWLGKILRVDVDGDAFPADPDANYAIPPANPFADAGDPGDDEIWAYGLRNPWRPSFDRSTGDLYIADVGQYTCEEINVQPAGSAGGENYGWRLREGTIQNPNPAAGGPKPAGGIDPIFDYPHFGKTCTVPGHGSAFLGFVVVGGFVYRGPIAQLQGRYFFTDYEMSNLWSLVWDDTVPPPLYDGTNFTSLVDHSTDPAFAPIGGTFDYLSSFGEDDAGNLYLLDLDGDVFRLPEPSGRAASLLGAAAVLALARWRPRSRISPARPCGSDRGPRAPRGGSASSRCAWRRCPSSPTREPRPRARRRRSPRPRCRRRA
jgi:hypothetical protein